MFYADQYGCNRPVQILRLSEDIKMVVPSDVISNVMQSLCDDQGMSVFKASHWFDTMPPEERAELIRLHAEDGDIEYFFVA